MFLFVALGFDFWGIIPYGLQIPSYNNRENKVVNMVKRCLPNDTLIM